MEPIKDAHGNYYYRKYINANPISPSQPQLSLENAYEKIAELIQIFDDNFNRVTLLEIKVKKLEEEKEALRKLKL